MGSGGCIPAEPDFLAELRSLCSEHGVLLIFDEVMTSRMSTGGAQQRLGIVPDLTTLGKYLGGGMTFGAFGGPAAIMAAFDPARGGTLTHGGTFNNNVMTMSAGAAAVEQLLDAGALEALFERGERFRSRVDAALAPVGMSATGWGSLLTVQAARGTIRRPADVHGVDPRIGELLFHAMLERGMYLARRGFIALSLAISDHDIDRFLAVLEDSLDELTSGGVSGALGLLTTGRPLAARLVHGHDVAAISFRPWSSIHRGLPIAVPDRRFGWVDLSISRVLAVRTGRINVIRSL